LDQEKRKKGAGPSWAEKEREDAGPKKERKGVGPEERKVFSFFLKIFKSAVSF
jgi:hypothetical protein